jgi:hypothetical protein
VYIVAAANIAMAHAPNTLLNTETS